MSTTELRTTTSRVTTNPPTPAPQERLFLTRGVIAIAWAAAFAAAAGSGSASVSLGVGLLLVAYPLIDAVASVIDARSQHGPARRLLLANAASSTLAAFALGLAATVGATAVVGVFGVWAFLSGAAQLIVALRRRAQLGRQWPMRLAGGVSVIGGVAYLAAAANGDPMLNMLAVYAATGGVDFVLQAWLLRRRQRRPVDAAPSATDAR